MDPDVIIIGAGQAGIPLATRLSALGRTVLLVERRHLGGTCSNYGCTPTKTMLASARAAFQARRAERLGVRVSGVEVDLAAVVDRKDAIVRQWREAAEARLERAGERLTVRRGHARFVGPGEIEVEGERYRAETVILDVGARPARPPIAGLDRVPALDNESLMEVRDLPVNLIVLGGGYVGCEFAQMFRRFGARVTVLDRGAHLLSREDPEISAALEDAFHAEEIGIELSAEAESVSGRAGEISVRTRDGREFHGSHLLVALGRQPNTDDLGCEVAGIELDERGYIIVDDHYRTSAAGVRAVGDATGGPQFTHASWDDHRILFDLLNGRSERTRASRVVPYAVFTDPQVARVGLSEREAAERGLAFAVASLPVGRVARAIQTDETAGLLRLIYDPRTERILGASIVGPEAGELIHIPLVLMQAGASVRAIVDAEFVHPTLAEGVQTLVMSLDRYTLE